jgi:Outer membrane protein beta-barrel domain
MQDPEFEKKVRQKMEELKFSPSGSVWTGVEAKIKKDRDRKRPLIWILLALGIALGGTFYLLYVTAPANSHKSVAKDAGQPGSSGPGSASERAATAIAKNKQGGSDSKASEKTKNLLGSRQTFKVDFSRGEKQKSSVINGEDLDAKNGRVGKKRNASTGINSTRLQETLSTDQARVGENNTKKPLSADQGLAFTNPGEKKTPSDNEHANSQVIIPGIAEAAHKPEGPMGQAAKKDTIAIKPLAQSKHPTKKNAWKFGFSTAGGISPMYQELFKRTAGSPVAYYSLSAFSSSPILYYGPSEIKPGFSFSAGFLAEKPISQKISISTGLSYHYFSNIIQTGEYYNGSLSLTVSNTSSININGYYRNGNTQSYTNEYHFLEMPINLQYQFSEGKKLHLFASAGFSIAELLETDALHFDYGSGAYYKNDALFNKTQVNGLIALQAGFYHRHTMLKIGPQLQYGLTNLLSSSTGDKQHMFFAGINLAVMPGKK